MFCSPEIAEEFAYGTLHERRSFMESVYRDMPIGSIFLWEMDRKSANLIRQSADVLPSFYNGNPKIWFVIDGAAALVGHTSSV